ncbi:MAG: deoxynucleoside kinase [Candidatus Hodarchaeota archaeon]
MSKTIYRNKGSKDNIVISIAGAHGVGKTTIYNLFKKRIGENNLKFKFYSERYKKIPPFPFGSHDKQIAFRSEIHFLQQLMRRNRNILKYDERYNGRIIVLDRTPICVLIYSKSLNLKEKDYQLLLDMYHSVEWREDYIIYLTAQPDTILNRIIQRGSLEKIRKEWNEQEKEYLLKIISYYNQFLSSKKEKEKIFIINTENLTAEDILKNIEEIITEISDYRFKKIVKPQDHQMNLINFLK